MFKITLALAVFLLFLSAPAFAVGTETGDNPQLCHAMGGNFEYLGGGMTACCSDQGCQICDKTGCHFDEALSVNDPVTDRPLSNKLRKRGEPKLKKSN